MTVVIAYRDLGCPFRRASFAFVRAWYERLGCDVVVESCEGSEFTRARAINSAVRRTDARVIVQADPDSLVRLDAVRDAVALASDQDGLVVAHSRWLYLNPDATQRVIAENGEWWAGTEDCEDWGEASVGNVVVFSRSTWEAVGGFDERFGMWGGDDAVFAYAADACTGTPTRRVAGDMLHLWHPRLPESVPGSAGYRDQFTFVAEYRDAAAVGRDAVRALIDARRTP